MTKVIRQPILAPASIGANHIKAAPRWQNKFWQTMITKPLISESSKADAISINLISNCKDLIDYHCITHRFWHASHHREADLQSSAMPLSRELIFDFFQRWTEINEPPFWSWQTCIQIRSGRIDVEIFSVILGKISAQPYHHWQLAFSISSKSIFQPFCFIFYSAPVANIVI